jgi:hypothetical protein
LTVYNGLLNCQDKDMGKDNFVKLRIEEERLRHWQDYCRVNRTSVSRLVRESVEYYLRHHPLDAGFVDRDYGDSPKFKGHFEGMDIPKTNWDEEIAKCEEERLVGIEDSIESLEEKTKFLLASVEYISKILKD